MTKCPVCQSDVKKDELYQMTYYCPNCCDWYSTDMVENYNLVRLGEA